jgi:hypothetical protein
MRQVSAGKYVRSIGRMNLRVQGRYWAPAGLIRAPPRLRLADLALDRAAAAEYRQMVRSV